MSGSFIANFLWEVTLLVFSGRGNLSLLDRLRAETMEHHQRLHVHPALALLTDETLTRPYLNNALEKFYEFYLPLERRYAASDLAIKADFPAGPVLSRLANDLHKAGIDADKLSGIEQLAEPFSMDEAIAYLYLREGSNMGGKVISKNLSRTLGLEPGVDNQFFWGHGDAAGQNWKLFLEKITELEPQINIETTAAFAASLFLKLDNWLHQKKVEHV